MGMPKVGPWASGWSRQYIHSYVGHDSGYDSSVCRYRGGESLVGDIVACRWIALEFECQLNLIFGIRSDSVTVS